MNFKSILIDKLNKEIADFETALLREDLGEDTLVIINRELAQKRKELQDLQNG
jgi:hypothetical protein